MEYGQVIPIGEKNHNYFSLLCFETVNIFTLEVSKVLTI